jgi:hypothetical protein
VTKTYRLVSVGLTDGRGSVLLSVPGRDFFSDGATTMSSETEADRPSPKESTPVDTVIDLLGKRVVSAPDRGRLRESLDRADSPQRGRAGADEGLGRAIGR